jgi:hypothetical protein
MPNTRLIPFQATAVAAAALTLSSAAASADLVGSTVSIWGAFQTTGQETLLTVAEVQDPGVEYLAFIGGDPTAPLAYSLDVGPTSIRMETSDQLNIGWFTPWIDSGFAPAWLEFRGLDFGPGLFIAGVNITFEGDILVHESAPADFPDISADNISFTAESVRISYGGYGFRTGSAIQIDLIVAPAPASLGLLAVAGLLGGRRRR